RPTSSPPRSPHTLLSHLAPSFSLKAPATPRISPLSLHDALPIWPMLPMPPWREVSRQGHCTAFPSRSRTISGSTACPRRERRARSEEHTSELQSLTNLVCRLLLEKKKTKRNQPLSASADRAVQHH